MPHLPSLSGVCAPTAPQKKEPLHMYFLLCIHTIDYIKHHIIRQKSIEKKRKQEQLEMYGGTVYKDNYCWKTAMSSMNDHAGAAPPWKARTSFPTAVTVNW